MKTYQRFMTERKGDTAVFTFGRFNPPTVGHEKLITAVQSVARQKGGDFFIYPSQSQDPKKNPLDRNTKIKYMKKMFTKFAKNIISSNAKTALDVAVELYNKKKYTNLVMVVGSDRVQDFKKLLQTYNGEEKKHGFYDFDSIDVVSAGERDPDAEGVEGMSASKMRAAAVDGDFKSFRMGTPPTLSDADTKKMFNDIRKGMKLDVVKEGKKWKEIDFETESVTEQVTLDKTHQITVGNFTTSHLHHSTQAFNVLDEMVNSLSGLDKKDEFYLKEAVTVLDEFLDIRNQWQKDKKINKKDLFFMEQLVKKYTRFMTNVKNSEVFDNSFIYKYISEIQETLEYGDYPSLVKYTDDTPGQDETVQESINKVVKYIMDKLNLSKKEADKIIQRAMEQGIDVLKIQQKFSMLEPTLTALVSEYKPERK
tara:strand:- start:1109 stop:2377 length:1269 start_codon:yes stop_codon:yes gene_type:complete